MNNRVEILKIVGQFCKKIKLPKFLMIIILVVVLMYIYIVQFFKRILKFLFPDKNILLNYSALIMVVLVIIFALIRLDGLSGLIYGDATEHNLSNHDVNNIQINSTGEIQQGQSNHESEHSSGQIPYEEPETSSEDEISSAGELWYLNVAKPEELVDGQLTMEQISKLSFYIKVNRRLNCITVYIQDEYGDYTIPVKAMRCSTGGEKTPLGIYNTSQKYEFRKLLYDVYGQYATRIVGQILFHSSSYEEVAKDTLIAEEFNKLGESISHGCIRLTVEDAKWIYEYCKLGTTIEIYEDDNPGPLGKPEVIKLPNDSLWDPTDISEDNPWNDKKPEIIVDDDKNVTLGHEVDLLEGIIAKDTCGNDVTDKIKVTGTVDFYRLGTYKIKYSVTDLLGRSTSKIVKFVVR